MHACMVSPGGDLVTVCKMYTAVWSGDDLSLQVV